MYTKSKILLRLQQPKTNLVLGLPWSEFVGKQIEGKKVKCWQGKKEIKSVGKDRERESWPSGLACEDPAQPIVWVWERERRKQSVYNNNNNI